MLRWSCCLDLAVILIYSFELILICKAPHISETKASMICSECCLVPVPAINGRIKIVKAGYTI